MQFLHVTIQGTLCLNIIVIAESLPIVTTCCSNASWSSVAVPQSGRQVLLLKIWISILYFFIPTSGLSVCTILHVPILNGVKYLIKDVFCKSNDQGLHKTTQANYKQNCSTFAELMKFNNWIWVKKRKLQGENNNTSHAHFSYWQPFFFKSFKHSFKCCPGTLV